MRKGSLLGICMAAAVASAQDWETVGFVDHSAYQAIQPDGSSAYDGGFPVRLVGVVLHRNEDWLDPTSDYDPGVHLWEMGGEAEFYLQAVDLDGTAWDPDPGSPFDDFGGTACWMGQNYGNHIMHQDPAFNYTEGQWYAELDRLGLWRPGTPLAPGELVRPGDLVEVRARGGLAYKGKMNVNEQHTNDPAMDFEIVIHRKGFGLPAPAAISLSDLKSVADAFLFDAEAPTREFGGELYQSALVELAGVRFADVSGWGTDHDVTVTDGAGRTLNVHLGLNGSFDTMAPPDPSGTYDVLGIMDQSDVSGTGGYQLLVMTGRHITPAPAPDPPGDATLDGVVNILDLGILASHYKQPGWHHWSDGDFTGDGVVNILDLGLLAAHYRLGPGGGESVPGPAPLLLLGLGATWLLRRRGAR